VENGRLAFHVRDLDGDAEESLFFHLDDMKRPPSLHRADIGGVRLLLVSDIRRERQALSSILLRAGCKVSQAADVDTAGQALLEAQVEAHPVEAVVVSLRAENGLELIRTLRKNAFLGKKPVLLLTPGETDREPLDWRELGLSAFLTKPITAHQLGEAVASSLSLSHSGEHLITVNELSRSALDRARVLVVDDTAVIRKLNRAYLESAGHTVVSAKTGAEAIEAMENGSFDLVLMDLELDGADGREVTRRLREFSAVPVLAITGHPAREVRESCLAAGIDDVLTKPVYPMALTQAVQRWAGKQIARTPQEADLQEGPPVDLNYLEQVFGGDPELRRDLMGTFIHDVKERLEILPELLREGDTKRLATTAHALAGAASCVGAERLRKQAEQIEASSRAGLLAEASGGLKRLQEEFEKIERFLAPSAHEETTFYTRSKPLSLTAGQIVQIDLHSFLNMVNIIIGELHSLLEATGFESELQPYLEFFLKLGHTLKEPRELEETFTAMDEELKRFRAGLAPIPGRCTNTPRVSEIVANLESIVSVLTVRAKEMLIRLAQPDRWVCFDIEKLKKSYTDILAAIEKNSKGRYHIVTNVAAKEEGDYLVYLDITGVDGKTLYMPGVFQDVFRDLIANARKYTQPGGTIKAGLHNDGINLRMVVEDNGRGIPGSEVSRVFDFGYRASNVADIPTKGAGFGLTKACWSATHFGGSITIDSGLGRGTRVSLTVPARPIQD
jgi:CheY-like chemotaxis protein/signal transduction histidine kinase